MSVCRFVGPEVVRLPLSDGDWIEVKRRLSGGERRRMSASAFHDISPSSTGGQKIGVDFATLGLARTLAYLVDWSFRDQHDKPVKCTPDAVHALDEDTLVEIERALDAHIESVSAESKPPSGEPASSQG